MKIKYRATLIMIGAVVIGLPIGVLLMGVFINLMIYYGLWIIGTLVAIVAGKSLFEHTLEAHKEICEWLEGKR